MVIYDEIQNALANARVASGMPEAAYVYDLVETRLLDLYAEMLVAMDTGAAWSESCLTQLESVFADAGPVMP
jgi:hypothetical protein